MCSTMNSLSSFIKRTLRPSPNSCVSISEPMDVEHLVSASVHDNSEMIEVSGEAVSIPRKWLDAIKANGLAIDRETIMGAGFLDNWNRKKEEPKFLRLESSTFYIDVVTLGHHPPYIGDMRSRSNTITRTEDITPTESPTNQFLLPKNGLTFLVKKPNMTVEEFKEHALGNLVSTENVKERYGHIGWIDKGGQGTVSKERCLRTNKVYAMKRMNLKIQRRKDYLLTELEVLNTLKHDNIVNFIEAFYIEVNNKDMLLLVMDYSSSCLRNILECFSIGLSETACLYVSHCTLSALAFLHSNLIIHRDVKSDNVLIDHDGGVKLTDFGHCTTFCQARQSLIGTPYWMSPEVIRRDKHTHKTDTWSFGILLIELIDGQPPYLHIKPNVATAKILKDTGLPPVEHLDKMSDATRSLLSAALTRDENARPSCQRLHSHVALNDRMSRGDFGLLVDRRLREADDFD